MSIPSIPKKSQEMEEECHYEIGNQDSHDQKDQDIEDDSDNEDYDENEFDYEDDNSNDNDKIEV